MKPGHFDLMVRDVEQASRFFAAVLGWGFEEMAPGYSLITAGAPDEPGIDGGIASIDDTPIASGPMTVLILPVDDLDARVRSVEAQGGQVLERRVAIPGVGWYASCAEPGGLIFGMMEDDENAG